MFSLTRWILCRKVFKPLSVKFSGQPFWRNIIFKKFNSYRIFNNPRKYENIYKLGCVPYQFYRRIKKTLKVVIYATIISFTINCGCKFSLLADNFNIKKWKNLRIFENASCDHSIWREQKYRLPSVGKKNWFESLKTSV